MAKNKLDQLKKIPEVQPLPYAPLNILSRLKEEKAKNDTDQKIKLSFEFFDGENKLFSLGNIENEWFTDLINEFNQITKLTRKQLFGEYKKKYKPHPYTDKSKLNFKDEFLTNPQYEAFQLRLEKSTGRMHGFFIDNVYYIRFLDKWHNMYNSPGYESEKIVPFPKTMCETLEEENQTLKQTISVLKNQNDENLAVVCKNCLECTKDVYKLLKFD